MSTSEDNLCPVCRETMLFHGYSVCNHIFCSKCIIKLRMFENRVKDLDLSSCPTCRTKLEKILIMKEYVPYENVVFSKLQCNGDYDIYFGDTSAYNHYESLIACVCSECNETCANMSALNRHCSNKHFKMYCDLCIQHARLLPHEFPLYNRPQLIQHRKWDKNKGHPPCEFCDVCFYDFDDLVVHIREKHFYCDLCLRMRIHVFFKSQKHLMEHYHSEHFVCQECRRLDKTNVFLNEIDLKAHRLKEHAAGRQKAELREEGSIPLEIRYNTPASGVNASAASSDRRYRGPRGGRDVEEDIVVIPPKAPEYEATSEDFPTLGSSTTNGAIPRNASWSGNVSSISGNLKQEDFPSLTSSKSKPIVAGAWTNKHIKSTTKPSASLHPRQQFSSARSSPGVEADYPSLPAHPGPPLPAATAPTGSVYSSMLGRSSQSSGQSVHHAPNFPPSTGMDDFPSLPIAAAPPTSVGWMLKAPVTISPNRFNPNVNQSAIQSSAMSTSNQPTKKPKKKKKSKSKSTEQSHSSQSNSHSIYTAAKPAEFAWTSVKNGAKVDTEDSESDSSDGDFPILKSTHGQLGNQFQAFQSAEPSTVDVNLVSYTMDNAHHSKPYRQAPKLTNDEFPSLKPTNKPGPIKQEKSNQKAPKQNRAQSRQDGGAFTLRDLASSLHNFVYQPPPDFDLRNISLINIIQSSLSPDQFNDFISIAGSYRQRQLDAHSFLKGCRTLMNENVQSQCLPEMLVLLPDIGLQKNFFDAIPDAWRVDLRECYVCGQICRLSDLTCHMSDAHADD